MESFRNTLHSRISERKIADIAIEHFKFYAPEVCKMCTKDGEQFFRVEGLAYGDRGEMKLKKINLGYYAPLRFDVAGIPRIDYDEIDSNLEGCKAYLRLMDGINIETTDGFINESYRTATRKLNQYILRKIEIRSESGLSK